MGNYKKFSRCVVHGSKDNLQSYKDNKGKFEITMLLNTLYLAVMYPIEKHGEEHIIRSEPSIEWRKNKEIIYLHENVFRHFNKIEIL